jgi:uncharacterized protein (TIGR00255 family)
MHPISPDFFRKLTMISSMTGYATASAETENGSLSLELRAVNHRYLDLQVRMPDELRCFEGALREMATAQLKRGKVECRINFSSRTAQNSAVLNRDLLKQLSAWDHEVKNSLPDAQSLSVADALRWNGVLETTAVSSDVLRPVLFNLFQEALQEFSASRAREGEKLKNFLLQRVDNIEALRNAVIPHVPAAIIAYEKKLSTRLRDAMKSAPASDLWDERTRQEITLFAGKIDVDEELSRLASHLSEMRRILTQGGTVGKRLDFLMQELNREVNTMASKSNHAKISQASVQIKSELEKVREQLQNIE